MIENVKASSKIRPIVGCYGIFVSLMLFQTSFLRLGTISAFVALVLIFGAFCIEVYKRGTLRWGIESWLLLAFALWVLSGALSHPPIPSYTLPMFAQMLVCIGLYSIDLSDREHGFLKKVFIWATVIYSILIIRSCLIEGSDRYVHGQIRLFNTELDPNYLGIPLVAGLTLLLAQILNGKRKWLYAILYLIVAGAIIFTSSRGNFLAAVITSLVYCLVVLFNADVPQGKKLALVLVLALAAAGVMVLGSHYLTEQWARMSEFGAAADNGRFALWAKSLKTWESSPIFGHGLGGMYRLIGKASHNTYLQLLSETGLIGVMLFVPLVCLYIKRTFTVDKVMFVVLIGMLFQIAFLDALDSRCVWVILIWISMLPKTSVKER